MKSFWAFFILFLVIIGLVGGGAYYIYHTKIARDRDNLQQQITDLNKKYGASVTANSNSEDSNTNTNTVVAPIQTNSNSAVVTPTDDVFSLTNLQKATVVVSAINYKLNNGVYTNPGTGPFAPEIPSTITLDQNHIVVDAANPTRAAIILEVGGVRHAGATVAFPEAEIMTNEAGVPTYLARVLLTDYVKATITSVAFASNVLTIKLTPSGGITETLIYKLSGNTLTKQ